MMDYEKLKVELDSQFKAEYEKRLAALKVVCGTNGHSVVLENKNVAQVTITKPGKFTMAQAAIERAENAKKWGNGSFTCNEFREYLTKNYSDVFTKKQIQVSTPSCLSSLVKYGQLQRIGGGKGNTAYAKSGFKSTNGKPNMTQEARSFLKALGGWAKSVEFIAYLKKKGVRFDKGGAKAALSKLATLKEAEKRFVEGSARKIEYRLIEVPS